MPKFPQSPATVAYEYLYRYIIEPDYLYLTKELERLGEMNVSLGAAHKTMRHKGHLIVIGASGSRQTSSPPHPSILEDVDRTYMELVNQMKERQYITNCLSFLIPDDEDYISQDIRDSFTDIVINNIPPLRALPRTRPPAFHIKNRPLQLEQWAVAEGYLEKYMANRLIFG